MDARSMDNPDENHQCQITSKHFSGFGVRLAVARRTAADGSAAAAPSQSVSQFRRGPPALTTPPPQRTAPLPSVNTSTPRGFWNFQASLLLFAGAGKNETNSPAVRCIASKRRRRQTLKCDTWGRRTRHDTHVDRAGPLARAPQEDLYGALVRSELTNRADTGIVPLE